MPEPLTLLMLWTPGTKAKTQKERTQGELFTQLSEGCGIYVLQTFLLGQTAKKKMGMVFDLQTFHVNNTYMHGIQTLDKRGADSIVQLSHFHPVTSVFK